MFTLSHIDQNGVGGVGDGMLRFLATCGIAKPMCFVPKFIFNMCFKLVHWVLQLLWDENKCMLFEHKTVQPSDICERQGTLYSCRGHWSYLRNLTCRMKEREREREEHWQVERIRKCANA